jgi:valyl-tRNA synthetase
MVNYKLIWDDFCSWYLEMVKPVFGDPVNESTLKQVKANFANVLTLLHPFMPFITEELYNALHDWKPVKPLIVTPYPGVKEVQSINDSALGLISEIRNIRNNKGLSPKVAFELIIKTEDENIYRNWEQIAGKLANVSGISYNAAKPDNGFSGLIGTDEFYIPYEEQIDEAEERKKMETELEYLQGFLKSVNAKLNNEKFVANAKADVLDKERQKKADAEEKIRKLREGMGGSKQ